MNLSELLKPWIAQLSHDVDVTAITNDSRAVRSGALFLAYPGAIADGRDYIKQALSLGACAVVYEPHDSSPNNVLQRDAEIGGICIPFTDLASQLSAIASRFYGEPAAQCHFTGVTGTNGKTTIAYQLAQAYDLLGQSAAYIGTLGEGKPAALKPSNNTTPDALVLQSLFHDYVQQGIRQVCMEVSSHALSQHRVDHIPFQQAIFTNLTHDHLDYHGTLDAYAEAKASLFAWPSLQVAILNQDDPYLSVMRRNIAKTCQVLTYGTHDNADVQAVSWTVNLKGTIMQVRSPWGEHSLAIQALGFFNLYNALAIFTSLMSAGYNLQVVVDVMTQLKPAPGRMEVVAVSPTVIVDYAHTPDALENVLSTLSKVKEGRILVVFGCGGDRDRLKRPIMGKIAANYADLVYLTSDNPRHENPEAIIDEIATGILAQQSYERIADRERAIARALNEAKVDDIVVIAGKGHEAYQQIGDVKIDFSDQVVVRKILRLEH